MESVTYTEHSFDESDPPPFKVPRPPQDEGLIHAVKWNLKDDPGAVVEILADDWKGHPKGSPVVVHPGEGGKRFVRVLKVEVSVRP